MTESRKRGRRPGRRLTVPVQILVSQEQYDHWVVSLEPGESLSERVRGVMDADVRTRPGYVAWVNSLLDDPQREGGAPRRPTPAEEADRAAKETKR